MRKSVFFFVDYFRITETVALVKGNDNGVVNILPKNGPTPNNSTPSTETGILRFGI